jgi:hypothetical protein
LIYNYQMKIFQFFIQKKIEGKYLCKIKGIIEMSNITANENMIPQEPPLVNPQNTNTSPHANNVIVPTPPATPAPIHPPRLERRNNSRAPVLMRSDSDHHVMLERAEPVCHDLVLDPSDFDYDSVLEPANPNLLEIFDPSIYMYSGYGPVLERSDSIRHTGEADTSDLIQPSILMRSGFIPPPTLIRNDSRPVINDDGPPPLIRLESDIFPHVYDFTSDDEYDVVQQHNFEWFPKDSSPSP